jgi:hypothetical protein
MVQESGRGGKSFTLEIGVLDEGDLDAGDEVFVLASRREGFWRSRFTGMIRIVMRLIMMMMMVCKLVRKERLIDA